MIFTVPGDSETGELEINGVQVARDKYPAIQRNAASVKDKTRVLPKPVTLTVKIDGHPARALVDSGSLGDFMSTNLADQLKVKQEELESPLGLQLAVQGSRSKINFRAQSRFQYQGIDEERHFDIINLSSYDLILGTPWMYQHQVCLGFNPVRVVIGTDTALPIKKGADTKLMAQAIDVGIDKLEQAREELRQYAEPLCKKMEETDLPPFRAINHTIPLIDEHKKYPWRPSRCLEPFRAQWAEKRDAYVKTGRWKITSSGNTTPMLLIPKPRKKDMPLLLRTVNDLRERNANTYKLTSPLPDMEGMLRRAARKKYRSSMDLADAYEQIRVIPEHVDRTTMTTPDGNMVSLVIQIGDANTPAMYQALMNHLFSAYIGHFMDIYLDDIFIYSDTLEEHIKHVKLIIDVLKQEKLYLSKKKLQFLAPELRILGQVVDDDGIRMDSDKVDTVNNWKIPTNRDLLRGFLGSVGYLADDVPGVRIPMGILSALTGDTVPFQWMFTEQRAFEDVKHLVHEARSHCRVPLNYEKGAPTIWMVTDGRATGISGLVSQGDDWKTATIAAFYLAKLNPAQQNYPVHEIEMFAGIETMLRHTDLLQGVKFKWITDHKGLTHLLNQKNLSGRQARWIEKISSFDFEVVYVPGTENVVADALSRIYSNDVPGTVRARSEYTYHDVDDEEITIVEDLPILAGLEARAAVQRHPWKAVPGAETGRPETSREFAARMWDGFILKGPVQRKEGEGTSTKKQIIEPSYKPRLTIRIKPTAAKNSTLPEIEGIAPTSSPPNTALTDLVSSSQGGIDLLSELRKNYHKDPFFELILKKPKEYRNFEVDNGLVYLKEKESRLICIPKVLIDGRSAREIVISEAHSLLAHLGASKTLDYLRDQCWWKDMVSDTKSFCETCMTCKRSKPSNQKPYGLLNPLSIPGIPWESIGMDFVGPLPKSSNRDGTYDSITVVICLLTAMVHLIPSRINYNARQLAELMFEEVYKHHGLPKNIISDRDVLFTSTFWGHLHKLLGTNLKMSSAYHPQTDGSTKRANRTVTQMLRQCINAKQTDWVAKLPAIEFAINSARSESTGFAPFFLNSGRMPRSMIWNSAPPTEFPSVRNFALQKKLALIAAHDSIIAARVKQTRDANRKRQVSPFSEGDLVYLSSKNIKFPKGLARKLIPKYLGPYKILKDFENYSFRVDLPSHLKQHGVHDVFHSSLLRIHHPNDDRLFPGRLDAQISHDIDPEGEWAVESILSHYGSEENALFEIKWRSGDITWMPYFQILGLQALESYFEALGINTILELTTGKGKPPHGDPQVFLGMVQLTSEPVSARIYNSSGSVTSYPNSPPCLSSIPPVASTSIMTKSSLPSFKRHPNHSDPPKPTALRTVHHPNIHRISDLLFVVTDIFASPVQHHLYPAATFYACLTHEGSIHDDPANMKDQPSPIGFDILARVYNADTRGTRRFAYYVNTLSNPAVINGDRMQPDEWNITPTQRGIMIENPIFQQLMEDDVARNLRRKAAIQAQIEKRQAIRLHKRDNDAIKQFTAIHQTKADAKLKGKKKAVSSPITTLMSLPITTTLQPVASGSATTFESIHSPVASTSTTDVSMIDPNDPFTLTADELIATFDEDAPFEHDNTCFGELPDTTL